MFASLKRVTKFAGQDFYRNFYLSSVTIVIIVLALFALSILVALNVLADQAIEAVREKVDVSLYIKPGVKEEEMSSLKNELMNLAEVKEIRYVSREEALASFRQRHKDNPLILEALEELQDNPLGGTLVVKAKSPEDYEGILTKLSRTNYQELIEEKDYHEHKQIIAKLNQIAKKVFQLGLAISGIFVLIAILVIFHTIRLAIYTHREEGRIMRLVGATSWFIRAPFLMEAIFFAVLAWAVSIAIVFGLLEGVQPYISQFLGGWQFSLTSYFRANFVRIFGTELLFVIILALISASTAIRRYLRV